MGLAFEICLIMIGCFIFGWLANDAFDDYQDRNG